MKAFGSTDVGCVRQMNQDYLFYSQYPVGIFPNLFIIADGMGGHKAGDLASRMTVDNFVDFAENAKSVSPTQAIEDGILYVNRLVREKSASCSEYRGMGTTLVIAYVDKDTLHVANIGDSRLYISNESIQQITQDHSYVGTLVRAGEITPEEARVHPDKNIITRAIGATESVKADFFEVKLKEGDRVLMCTDGLSNMLTDDVLRQILDDVTAEEAVETLIDEAKENGGTDNITALVIIPIEKEDSEC